MRLVNFPDFLADPSGTKVGTRLDWDGSSGIGGYFGYNSTPPEHYTITGSEGVTELDTFNFLGVLKAVAMKTGEDIYIGGYNAAATEKAELRFYTTVDDQIESVDIRFENSGGSEVSTFIFATPVDVSETVYLRVEWEYIYYRGFPTSRLLIKEADGTVLMDASSNVSIVVTLDRWGVFSEDALAVGTDPYTEAYLTALTVEYGTTTVTIDVDPLMIEKELGAIARMETSVYHETLRTGQLDEWILSETAYLLETCGLDTTDFDAQTNATAEQLERRTIMFRDAILFRVCVRLLMKADANRSQSELKRYEYDIRDYLMMSDRRALHVQRLFHPDSEAATLPRPNAVTAYKPIDSNYPLRPVDEEE